MTSDDRAAHDEAWLDEVSRGDPVLKQYLRKRMSEFLDWAEKSAGPTAPDDGGEHEK